MTKLKPYQQKGVKIIERLNGRALLADEMGLGKTIQVLKYIQNHPELRPVIVVCPATVKWVWELQAKKHVGIRATILEGTKPPPETELFKLGGLLVVNYDIMNAWLTSLLKLKPQILIIDECHYQKSSKAKRTKAIHKLATHTPIVWWMKYIKEDGKRKKRKCKGIPHIIAISGTPLTNRPAELYTTLHLLWPKEFPTFHTFAWRYCKPVRKPWGWEFNGASHLDELHERLKKLGMIRRLKKDVMKELPDKTRVVVPLELKKIKEYREAESDFIAWLRKNYSNNKVIKASTAQALTKLGYLKRLAARLKLKSVKRWMDEFLESSDGKLVIFCIHKKIIKKLHQKYRKISVVVDGSVVGKNRHYAVQKFQNDKKIRLFIGNIQAAGIGIDLWAASTCAFVELDWVPGNHTQAEDRLHRIGQKDAVTIYYLIAKGTIEEKISKIIQKKQEVLTATLDGKKITNHLNIFDKLQKLLLKNVK